jgi:hypothetical protein
LKVKPEFEHLARAATRCRECFTLGEVKAPYIDVAQPRWVGPKYWTCHFRVVILMCNPGQSQDNSAWAKKVRRLIHEFREGTANIRTILKSQREAMNWSRFYIDVRVSLAELFSVLRGLPTRK